MQARRNLRSAAKFPQQISGAPPVPMILRQLLITFIVKKTLSDAAKMSFPSAVRQSACDMASALLKSFHTRFHRGRDCVRQEPVYTDNHTPRTQHG
jgi:hypothetical protein